MTPFEFHIRTSKVKGQTTQDSCILFQFKNLQVILYGQAQTILKKIFRFLAEPKLSINIFIEQLNISISFPTASILQLFWFVNFSIHFPINCLTNSCLLHIATICTFIIIPWSDNYPAIVITGHYLVFFFLIKSDLSTKHKHLHLKIYEITCI